MESDYKINYQTDWRKHFIQKQSSVCLNNHTLLILCLLSVHLNVHVFAQYTQDNNPSKQTTRSVG